MLAKNGLGSRLCWARGQVPTSENPHGSSGDRKVSSWVENAVKKMMLEIAAVSREETNEDDPWTRRTKKTVASATSQTTWKGETGLLYTRKHPLPLRGQPQLRQAQRDPSDRR